MVGEEGTEFEARDYRKLTEVIVEEYLSEEGGNYPTVSKELGSISSRP